jgi:hypothetical protein
MEFEIGPKTEKDLGGEGKQHKLQFHKLPNSAGDWSMTNVEFLTDEELADLHSQICAYMEWLHG